MQIKYKITSIPDGTVYRVTRQDKLLPAGLRLIKRDFGYVAEDGSKIEVALEMVEEDTTGLFERVEK